jgi:hypothetical protein
MRKVGLSETTQQVMDYYFESYQGSFLVMWTKMVGVFLQTIC